MIHNRSPIGIAITVAMAVSCLSLAAISQGCAEPGGRLVIDRHDNEEFDVPSDAVIIEEQSLGSKKHPDRALILWMVNPTKNPSDAQANPEAPYMCPDETRGSYYSGPTRVSLLNTRTRTVINTIEIKYGHFEGMGGIENKEDSFAIPYAKIGRAHVLTPVTDQSRMPSSA